jgi:hypothetical protein
MRYRKLRIAWSVAWGIACVLLIVLWVRGHYYADDVIFGHPKSGMFDLISSEGGMWLYWNGDPPESTVKFGTSDPSVGVELPETSELGFAFDKDFSNSSPYWCIAAPNWLLALTCAALVVAPWMRQIFWRFSLRALLIATTLVAVVLGLAAWHFNAAYKAQRADIEKAIRDGVLPAD